MNPIRSRSKALCVDPLSVSARVGATLAFLGLGQCMPIEHGVRGCTAFTKLFFMRHFREPIALQTTAVDEVATIVGADENVIEALNTVIERYHPEIVGLMATVLAEFQGTDLRRTLAEFRRSYPSHAGVSVIPVLDFQGVDGLEAGYARAVEAIIESLVPETRLAGARPSQINVLTSAALTPGDVESLKGWVGQFGLTATVLPDLADSLDGHVVDDGYLPLTYGGTTRASIEQMGLAAATIVVGPSMEAAANMLKARTLVPDYRFASLMGVAACDRLTHTLAQISKRDVAPQLCRQRARLLDAMVDCQFFTAGATASVAGEPDSILMLKPFLEESGIRIHQLVASAPADSLQTLDPETIAIGDLDDLRTSLGKKPSHLVLANSHARALAEETGAALLRVGYPQHDFIGAHSKVWIGYEGTRQTLYDVSNLLAQARKQNQPFHSVFKFRPQAVRPNANHANHAGSEP